MCQKQLGQNNEYYYECIYIIVTIDVVSKEY